MQLSVRFGVMRPKYRQPGELKFSPRFFLTPLMEYGLCYVRRSGLLICQPDFYKQFHPELDAAEIQGSSYFSYDHPCKGEGVLGGCKRRYCSAGVANLWPAGQMWPFSKNNGPF